MSDTLSTKEFAEKWGCSPDTVRKWCREGKIPCAYQLRQKGDWYIPKDAEPPECFMKRKNREVTVTVTIK